MTTMNTTIITRLMVTLSAALAVPASAQLFEAYYLNNRQPYPNGETPWSNDAQGVAHDDNNWFITTTHGLYKIPVGLDLDTVSASSPGVLTRNLSFPDLPDIYILGYHHFGDPVVYRACDEDYLLVPIEGQGIPGAIALFRCSDLSFIHHFILPNQCNSNGQFCNDAGWCAVDTLGRLFTSRQHTTSLIVYNVDWLNLCIQGQLVITFAQEIPLTNEQGGPLDLATMQGGEFAPGDHLLYLVSGFYDDDDGLEELEGIHVIETAGWQRVAHSTRGYGHFDYYYDPGFPTYEEPEGLTIWDLDDGSAPGITGQLHVIVSDNDAESGDVDFKHYTNIIRVVANGACAYAACCTPVAPPGCPTPFNETCEFGVAECPFRTIQSALNAAWKGAEIRIGPATYAETMTISKRVRLTSAGGTVRIGG